MDDHQDGSGRYDIYTFHSVLSAGPLFRFWPREDAARIVRSHAGLADPAGKDPHETPDGRRAGARDTRQVPPRPRVSAGRAQSMWKTSRSSLDTGLLSGFDGMMSFMWAHHFLQMVVFAMAFQRASSSIST